MVSKRKGLHPKLLGVSLLFLFLFILNDSSHYTENRRSPPNDTHRRKNNDDALYRDIEMGNDH